MSDCPQSHIVLRYTMKTVFGFWLGLVVLAAPPAGAFAGVMPPPPQLQRSVWNFGDAKDDLSSWTKAQAGALHRRLCGKRAKITRDLTGPFCILVGTPENNPFVKQAVAEGLVAVEQLGEDDYLLKQTKLAGRPVLIIAGRNPRAAMYGVFDFFEQLGCRFLISRDVVPETRRDLTIPPLDVLRRTDNTWRGLGIPYCVAMTSLLSVPDYQALFDQMAKMRMNRIMFWHFDTEPFGDYSYQGERKLIGDISHPDSGYISYGRTFSGSYLVKDIPIGREKFGPRRRVAPLEFQNVASSDEALDTGKEFMRELMKLAKARGLGSWTTVNPCFVTPNMTKYTRPMPRNHEHWAAHVSCTDPVVTEINRAKIQNLVASYPDAEGIMLHFPEGHYDDPYPDAQALIKREWPNYAEVLRLMREADPLKTDASLAMVTNKLRTDIRFVEITRNTVRVAREVKPDLRLGVLAICKAPILTHLDRILPKDMPFVDIESGSLWGGNPLHLFKQMEGRDCVIIPRAVDDGSMAGLQFNLNLYQRDRFLQSTRENGTKGFIIQTTHIRGNEHNVKFLSEGLWNDQLTPQAFYKDYCQALFGPDAAKLMFQAFELLEENEKFLGGRGGSNLPWNQMPPEILALRPVPGEKRSFYWSPASDYSARRVQFRESIKNLRRAADLFDQAKPRGTKSGQRELHYLIQRNQGYIHHLETLAQISEVYAAWRDALATRRDGVQSTREKLSQAVALARQAEAEAAQSANHFAECAEHPTDLGVLWMISTKLVVGTRVIRQHLDNLLAFYSGREYWNKVDWELLFGITPFPAYELKSAEPGGKTAETFEPG